jgi:hypothetical protein
LRDNLLYIIIEELEALLLSIKIHLELLKSGNINYFKDNKLYIAIKDINPKKPTKETLGSSNTNIT